MFKRKGLEELLKNKKHIRTLKTLGQLEQALNDRFYGMEDAVGCMMLAAASGEAMLMIGPPGTAKSRLVRSFCNLLNLVEDDALKRSRSESSEVTKKNDKYFEYLLTQFTEPSELFGYYDLAKLMGSEKKLERDDEGMMQHSHVVFLDEVFNASSAILNSLLTFMNEGNFHDRGKVIQTPMRLLFSATNSVPQDPTLGAVYDRFLLRCRIENTLADANRLKGLLGKGWLETHALKIEPETKKAFATLLVDLDALRTDIDEKSGKDGTIVIDPGSEVFGRLADLCQELRRKELSEMSNRRLVKFAQVILLSRLFEATKKCGDPAKTAPSDLNLDITPWDLRVLLRFGLDKPSPDDVSKIEQEWKQD